MNYTGHIHIKQILDDLLEHPLLQDLTLERVLNSTIHFMRIVGMPKMFTEKTATIKIKDYRGLLPEDYYQIIQVKLNGNKTIRPSTDVFSVTNNSYKIQGNIIYSSIEEGEINISYKAIEIDNEGFPLLPDNSSFIRALELFIKKQQFTVLFDLGKITAQILNNVQQEYAWAVGQCQSDLVRPTIDEWQNFTNMWNTLVVRSNEHNSNFANLGHREIIKIH